MSGVGVPQPADNSGAKDELSAQLAAAAARATPRLASQLKTLATLDEDGRHINVVHYCVGQQRLTFMLPWPNWRAVDGQVEPSIRCRACGFHECITLSKPHASAVLS